MSPDPPGGAAEAEALLGRIALTMEQWIAESAETWEARARGLGEAIAEAKASRENARAGRGAPDDLRPLPDRSGTVVMPAVGKRQR